MMMKVFQFFSLSTIILRTALSVQPSIRNPTNLFRRSLIMRGGADDSSHEKLTLQYFDAKGAAELTRVLLKLGGIAFEDQRYSIKFSDGKFETPEFEAAKAIGDLAANMDRAPVLKVGEWTIGQSRAMERYAAKIGHMMGTNDKEAAVIDSITENIRDIKDKWGKVRMMGGMGAPNTPEKEAALKKWFEEELGQWLIKLERSLPSTAAEGYAVGSALSYADVCIWNLLRESFETSDHADALNTAITSCPRLVAIADKVGEISQLKEWLVCRPKTMF